MPERIIGVDVGFRHFAVASDGYIQHVDAKQTVDSVSHAIKQLGEHLSRNADIVVVEDLRGDSLLAQNIAWLRLSLKRRFPYVRVLRADHDFPSSCLCNRCGVKNTKTRKEVFVCIACGHEDSRDLNAAKNLRDWRTRTFQGWSAV